MKTRNIALAALMVALFLAAIHIYALSVKPAAAMSNGAPRLDCTQCHQDAKNRPAEVEITGVPQKAEPGKEYKITIKIVKGPKSAGAAYGGFAFWASAGKLIVVDEKNTFETNTPDGPIITHTKDGSMKREWTVAWKAPDKCTGPIKLVFSVIAANGDGTFNGDAYARKEFIVQCAGGGAGGAAGGQATTSTKIMTSPVTTIMEHNTGLAFGVAVLIFVVFVAGYILFAARK